MLSHRPKSWFAGGKIKETSFVVSDSSVYVDVMCVLVCIFLFVQNKVKEMHFQLANYLAKKFCQILIPALPVSEFVKREKRKLGKKTFKNMLAWSHYAFPQRFKSTVRRHPWCEV